MTYFSDRNPPGWYTVPTSEYPAPAADGGGNGFDTLPQTQTAKNGIVVGSVADATMDPYYVQFVSIAASSSRGGTNDGRIKPDLVANGVGVFSSIATADDAYGSKSGTSMAAPNVTGTAALLIEHYENLFGTRPKSATTKAVLIHTAFDAGNKSPDYLKGPDYTYGWGLVDAAAAATFLTDANTPGQAGGLAELTYSGTEWTHAVTCDGADPLKVTIVWTDPAGDANAGGVDDDAPALVNDLDLWIADAAGNVYHPWQLDPASPADAATR